MSIVVTPRETSHATLIDFFCAHFPHISAAQWATRFAAGHIVCDATGAALFATSGYQPGFRIRYEREIENEPAIPFHHRVLFQDAHIVVADKPHFLPVVPSGRYVRETLLARLRASLNLPDLTPIHRIDQDTAGLVVFSVNAHERGAYQRLFATRAVRKTYEAIAPTIALPAQPVRVRLARAAQFMQAAVEDGEPNTETEMRIKSTFGADSLYELKPHTGARHQLRAVMAHLGAPIANDRIYPTLLPHLSVEAFAITPPLQLLAKAIAFTDPLTGEARSFATALALNVPLEA